jgi:hemolysin activation/secretion protein
MRFRMALFAAGALLLMAGVASAQPQSNFSISAGVFPTNFSTSAVLSGNGGANEDVDFENDLGLKSRLQNVRLEGFWRFASRQRLDFGYTRWRRDGEKTINFPIDWQDRHYDAGATLAVVNNADFIKLAYSYSFIKNDTTDFAGSFGFDTIWNKTSLEGQGTLTGNGQTVSGTYKTDTDFVAPAPLLGLNVQHLFTPNWMGRASGEYFQATLNNSTFKVLDARASVDWLFGSTWGAGAGFNYVGFKVKRKQFDAKYDFSGPLLYVTYRR